MNLYLNYLKDKEKFPGENDPISIILWKLGSPRLQRYVARPSLSDLFKGKKGKERKAEDKTIYAVYVTPPETLVQREIILDMG